MLAGATFDLKLLTAYCGSPESSGDLSCGYSSNSAKAPESFLRIFSAPQKDSRIKMIVLLDPALGSAVNSESLRAIKLPTMVVGATNNDFLPWKNHGFRYATEIPNAKTNLLMGQEGHFVFLNTCDNKIKVMGVSLCEDRAGVDRKATQENVARVLVEFVRSENGIAEAKTITEEYHKSFNVSEDFTDGKNSQSTFMITTIIMNTPSWVFGILVMLVVFGLMQTHTRQVPIRVALFIPVVMLILSINGVIGSIGWQLPALSLWLLGITIVTFIYVKFFSQNLAIYDVTTKKLKIRGSWSPLFIILGIFLTRYTLGVATAMNFDIVHDIYFPLILSLILGSASGFFLARGIVYLRVKKSAF